MIEKLRPDAAMPGDIVHVDGRVLGRHEGILRYTVGQRRGIGVATGEPLYVVALDAESARVIVGPRSALETATVLLRDINWLGGGSLEDALKSEMEIAVKVRSTRPPVFGADDACRWHGGC
ncbi:MAG: tRNA methyl transferase PRC-barrel domain-containing protein [Tepidamorphaceae bacterium]